MDSEELELVWSEKMILEKIDVFISEKRQKRSESQQPETEIVTTDADCPDKQDESE